MAGQGRGGTGGGVCVSSGPPDDDRSSRTALDGQLRPSFFLFPPTLPALPLLVFRPTKGLSCIAHVGLAGKLGWSFSRSPSRSRSSRSELLASDDADVLPVDRLLAELVMLPLERAERGRLVPSEGGAPPERDVDLRPDAELEIEVVEFCFVCPLTRKGDRSGTVVAGVDGPRRFVELAVWVEQTETDDDESGDAREVPS
jgi:hypothetical protein